MDRYTCKIKETRIMKKVVLIKSSLVCLSNGKRINHSTSRYLIVKWLFDDDWSFQEHRLQRGTVGSVILGLVILRVLSQVPSFRSWWTAPPQLGEEPTSWSSPILWVTPECTVYERRWNVWQLWKCSMNGTVLV